MFAKYWPTRKRRIIKPNPKLKNDMANLKPLPIKLSKKDTQRQWFVVYCKPNTEKKTAARLADFGIKVYCPLKTELKQWSDRKKKVEVPVLPSMLMVNLKEVDRAKVFQVPTVVRYLFWLKKPAVVRDKEVEELQNILSGQTSQVTVESMQMGEAIKLSGLGFDEQDAVLKYVTKSHYCVYLERLGFMVKVKK